VENWVANFYDWLARVFEVGCWSCKEQSN